jgi:membrane protein required for beta-lactamase induction
MLLVLLLLRLLLKYVQGLLFAVKQILVEASVGVPEQQSKTFASHAQVTPCVEADQQENNKDEVERRTVCSEDERMNGGA